MKNFIWALPLFLNCACNTPSTESAASKAENTTNTNSFGEKIEMTNGISVADLNSKMNGITELDDVVIEAKITDVCQEMGCWMNVEKGDGSQMFVKMKDHEFFVPKDAAGKTALISGKAVIDTMSVEDQKHYAEDAHKPQAEIDAITTPKYELSFIADGVVIK